MIKKLKIIFYLIFATNMLLESNAAALKIKENDLFKRQNHQWHLSFFKEMCSTDVKWNNACGGKWLGVEETKNAASLSSQHVPHYQALTIFKNEISTTFNELRSNTSEININDTNKTWATHKKFYKFLPRIKRNSKLSLSTWHRQVQIYVASFTFLRRAQLFYDFKRYNEETSMSKTLRKFELAALHILCEIEATINITAAHSKRSLHLAKSRTMQRILKFRTKAKHFHTESESCADELMQTDVDEASTVNSIDLKFVKFRFLSFLRAMRKVVKQKILTKTNISGSSGRNLSKINSSSINNNNSGISSSNSNTDYSMLNSRSFESNRSNYDSIKSTEFNNLTQRKRQRKHHRHQFVLNIN